MCIRDRVVGGLVVERDVVDVDLDPARGTDQLERVGDDVQVCLLYTSDAADDLLCVDLGGRRIIKKKNRNHRSSEPLSTHLQRHTIHPN